MHKIAQWCHAFACCGLLLVTQQVIATPWTLESSIRHALEQAPELREHQARLDAARAAVRQAGAWPNPALELRIDDRLALEFGEGGREISSLGVIQPLPWRRLGPQREFAEAGVAASIATGGIARLELEYRIALAFHRLQHAQAVLDLARHSATQAGEFAAIGQRRAEAGDIARREQLRLDLLAAQARQAIEEAEGEWSEAVAGLAVLLDVAPAGLGRVAPFGMPSGLPGLDDWLAAAESHPAVRNEQAMIDSVEAERSIARSERLPRLELVLYRGYEPLAGEKEAVTGAGLNVELPLWDRRNGRLDELTARRSEVEARLQGQRRVRHSDVRTRFLHLAHLLEQTRRQEAEVLAPAREVLALTRQAYAAGEIDLPSLIDAVGLVRGAESDRQSLLLHAWRELARLRADAGVLVNAIEGETGNEP